MPNGTRIYPIILMILNNKNVNARDFYNKEEKYSYFTKLTKTGISDDLDKIMEFAEDYHQAKLKLLSLHNVVGQSGQLEDFVKHLQKKYGVLLDQYTETVIDGYKSSN